MSNIHPCISGDGALQQKRGGGSSGSGRQFRSGGEIARQKNYLIFPFKGSGAESALDVYGNSYF